MKSIAISVAYVAWRLGHDPKLRVIVVSYSAELAAELHRQFRMVVKASWYAELFSHLGWAKETSFEFVTSRGGGRYATSVGGTLTGRGADLIIVDDPLNAAESPSEVARRKVIDWFAGTLASRLNDKTRDPMIVVAQRLHDDNLPGHLLRAGGWEICRFRQLHSSGSASRSAHTGSTSDAQGKRSTKPANRWKCSSKSEPKSAP